MVQRDENWKSFYGHVEPRLITSVLMIGAIKVRVFHVVGKSWNRWSVNRLRGWTPMKLMIKLIWREIED